MLENGLQRSTLRETFWCCGRKILTLKRGMNWLRVVGLGGPPPSAIVRLQNVRTRLGAGLARGFEQTVEITVLNIARAFGQLTKVAS